MNISDFLRKKIKRSIGSGDFQEKFITYELKTKLYDKKIVFYDEERHEPHTGLDFYLETDSKVFSVQAKKITLNKASNQDKQSCNRKLKITLTKSRQQERTRIRQNLKEILNYGKILNHRDLALVQFILWNTPRLRQEHLMEVTRILEEHITGIKTYPLIFFYTTPTILKQDKNASILFCDACDLIDLNINSDITLAITSKKNGRKYDIYWSGKHKDFCSKIKLIEAILIQNKTLVIDYGKKTLEQILNKVTVHDLIKNQNGFFGLEDSKYNQYLDYHFEGFYKFNSIFNQKYHFRLSSEIIKDEILKNFNELSHLFRKDFNDKPYLAFLQSIEKKNIHPYLKELISFEESWIKPLDKIKEEMKERSFSKQLVEASFPVFRAEIKRND